MSTLHTSLSVEQLPFEVAVLSADGTILAVNEQWEEFAEQNRGSHHESWVGENYFDICESEDSNYASATLDGLKELLSSDSDHVELEHPCHTPNEQRWFMLDATALETDGETQLLVTHRDITERKLAETRADARAEQLETLIEVLTHDLRNPLQIIDAHADLLGENLDDNENIQSIKDAVVRMTEITEATLDFSRSGELSDVEGISLDELATHAWEAVETGDATLTVQGTTTVHGDRELLRQLFGNLVENSIRHAGTDCAVTVGLFDDGFYVEDDGPGIPPDIREKAVLADFSTRGTGGLGLAIVQAVAQAHGGSLQITDSDTSGARVELTGFEIGP